MDMTVLRYHFNLSSASLRFLTPAPPISLTRPVPVPSYVAVWQVCVVSQAECYHGDTLGCMDASAPTVFNSGQHPWYTPRTLSLQPPTVAWVEGRLQIMVRQPEFT